MIPRIKGASRKPQSVNVRVDAKTRIGLQRIAKANRTTLSEVIRQALTSFITGGTHD